MNEKLLREMLIQVSAGRMDVVGAVTRLRHLPLEEVGFANIDHHRAIRCGFPEVIYCPGKTVEQIAEIFSRLAAAGANVLATRATRAAYQAAAEGHPKPEFHELAGAITLRQCAEKPVGH